MAQHDMNIANQGFPATRADLNNALQALATNNSGTSAPSTTFANQWWYDTTNNKLYIRNEANNAWIEVAVLDQTNNEWQITTGVIQAKDGDGLALKTDDGTTRLFIKDSDGSIGIGTQTTSTILTVDSGSAVGVASFLNDTTSSYATTDGGIDNMLILSSTGTSSTQSAGLQFSLTKSGETGAVGEIGTIRTGSGTSALVFRTRDNSTGRNERFRVSSDGKVMVGKTSDDNSVDGVLFDPAGMVKTVRASSICAIHNRRTSDGDIVQFRKDDSTVGSLMCDNGKFKVNGASGNNLLMAVNGTNYASFDTIRFYPTTDDSYDLGVSSNRFDDVFATNGTIQTSDEREKQQIASLTDAEMTAAKAISKLFKTFKWNSSVDENGDGARIHAGVIAQQVEQAMTDAGLTASNYAFWCSDTWWETYTEVAAVEAVEAQDAVYDDDDNLVSEAVEAVEAQEAYTRTDTYETLEEAPEGATERNRKGIRYPELLSFIGAATEQRLTSIEARLDALEG